MTVARAMTSAARAAPSWDATSAAERAQCLERAADLIEARHGRFTALLQAEAGKTLDDALAEIREAVDFCRYYAAQARIGFGEGEPLPGPAGEDYRLALQGRGVFVCISPWNFPLAIFAGQVTAALAAGNAVVAKPAEQTPLIAFEAVELLHEAGVPKSALAFVKQKLDAYVAQRRARPGGVFRQRRQPAPSWRRRSSGSTAPPISIRRSSGRSCMWCATRRAACRA